jgi:hypothetical protein
MQSMSPVSRQLKAGLVIAAGCLLTAACAGTPTTVGQPRMGIPVPAASDYVRMPVSTLVSKRDLPFKLAQMQRGADRLTLLMHQPAGGEPSPVAVISSSQSGDKAHVSLHRLPLGAGRADAADLDVATWEHLYVLAIGQEPEARFCLAYAAQPCDAARHGYSHADLLRELVRARQHAVERAHPGGNVMVPWRVVSMAPAPASGADADEVGVRVTSEQGPMEGASVFFNKAPHSSCVARSREDGLATCHLVDQHGDDGSHAEDDHVAVVATFPGDVRGDRVLVPTTLVMQPVVKRASAQ